MHKSWHQPESQPDFGAEFHTESLTPICYERRIGNANGLHDLIFLSSYVHDGAFRLDQVRLRQKNSRDSYGKVTLGAFSKVR